MRLNEMAKFIRTTFGQNVGIKAFLTMGLNPRWFRDIWVEFRSILVFL